MKRTGRVCGAIARHVWDAVRGQGERSDLSQSMHVLRVSTTRMSEVQNGRRSYTMHRVHTTAGVARRRPTGVLAGVVDPGTRGGVEPAAAFVLPHPESASIFTYRDVECAVVDESCHLQSSSVRDSVPLRYRWGAAPRLPCAKHSGLRLGASHQTAPGVATRRKEAGQVGIATKNHKKTLNPK